MTWPNKIQIQRQRQWHKQMHSDKTFKERSQRLVTFDTFDQSDEDTWPDEKKTMTKTKTKTMTKTYTFSEHLQRAIRETYDLLRHLIRWWYNHGQENVCKVWHGLQITHSPTLYTFNLVLFAQDQGRKGDMGQAFRHSLGKLSHIIIGYISP